MLTLPNINPTSLLPPFEEGLSSSLRLFGERALLEYHGLTRDTYSTERFLSGVASKPGDALQTALVRNRFPLHFEALSPELSRYCTQHGLTLVNDLDALTVAYSVETARCEIINPHPSLSSAVSELVWRCHMLHAQDDDYDVSFSDPGIPFSVFLSAPARRDRRSILRVAESLVHETMHLQLTLFEGCCPLVDTASLWSMYSPWKRQERPAQGILHGLYVFHVLCWMWQQVLVATQNEIDCDFALRRITEIKAETSSVRALEDSPALTESGHMFLEEIFGRESSVERIT